MKRKRLPNGRSRYSCPECGQSEVALLPGRGLPMMPGPMGPTPIMDVEGRCQLGCWDLARANAARGGAGNE